MFQVGDVVKCIRGTQGEAGDRPQLGRVYSVAEISSDSGCRYVHITAGGGGWDVNRFILADQPTQEPESPWREVDRNTEWTLWRHENGAEVCHRSGFLAPTAAHAQTAKLWRRRLGRVGYMEVDTGLEQYGYVPRDESTSIDDCGPEPCSCSPAFNPSCPEHGEQPGIDPDDARYAATDDSGTAALMRKHDEDSGATRKLLAALEAEKPRERKVPHPHVGRCFALSNSRRDRDEF